MMGIFSMDMVVKWVHMDPPSVLGTQSVVVSIIKRNQFSSHLMVNFLVTPLRMLLEIGIQPLVLIPNATLLLILDAFPSNLIFSDMTMKIVQCIEFYHAL